MEQERRLATDRAWLARLARALVADEATAQDLVQDTWLRAVRQERTGGAIGRGWLLRVLHSRIWSHRRTEAARASREAAWTRAHEEGTSTDELVERAELQARVAEALTELPDPLRRTALLRYLDARSTEEIASLTGVGPDAVRARLRRALDLLRTRLAPTDRSALALVLVGRNAIDPLVPTAAPVIALFSAMSLTKKAIVAVLLLVAVGAVIAVQGPAPRSAGARGDVARTDVALRPVDVAEPVVVARAEVDGPTRDRRITAASDDGSLVVRVRTHAGRPMNSVEVATWPSERDRSDVPSLWGTTDAAGECRLSAEDLARLREVPGTGSLRVVISQDWFGDDGSADVALVSDPLPPVELTVHAVQLSISAREPNGDIVSGSFGAIASLATGGYASTRAVTGTGSLWIPHGIPYEVRVHGYRAHRDSMAEFPAAGASEVRREHTLEFGPPYPALRVRVIGTDGVPLPEGARVALLDRAVDQYPSSSGRVEVDGRTLLPLQRSGKRRVSCELRADDGARWHALTATVEFDAPNDGEVCDFGDVQLTERARLVSGRLETPEGIYPGNLSVDALVERAGRWEPHPSRAGESTDSDGHFWLLGEGSPARQRLEIGTGHRTDAWELVLASDPSFETGDSVGTLRLVRPGYLTGRFVGASIRSAIVEPIVRPDGVDTAFSFPGTELLDVDSVAEFTIRVPPGGVDLRLREGPEGPVIHAIAGLHVTEGATLDLGDITLDLSEEPVLRFGVAPEAGAQVFVRPAAGSARGSISAWMATVEDDVARIGGGGAPLDVTVLAPGYSALQLHHVDRDLTVTLEPSDPLEIDLLGTKDVLARWRRSTSRPNGGTSGYMLRHVRLRVTALSLAAAPPLERPNRHPVLEWVLDSPFEPAEQALIPLLGPGRYRLRVDAPLNGWSDEFDEPSETLPLLPPIDFEVLAGAPPPTLTVDLVALLP